MGKILVVYLVMAGLAASASQTYYTMFVGTYTGQKSKGIYALRMNERGKLTPLGLVAETPNPSFLAVHRNKKFLYAVNERDNGGTVTAFSINARTGKLTKLNDQPSHGAGPCHVIVDQSGKTVMVANYGAGS